MKYKDINKIEDVEGDFHIAFVEGKKLISDSEYYTYRALFSLLFFVSLVLIFILFTGFNMFYIYFVVAFLLVTVVMVILGIISKRKGKKECTKAIENSSEDLIKFKTTKDKERFKFFKPVINDYNNTKEFIKKNTKRVKNICVKTKNKYKNWSKQRKEKKENKKIFKK